MEMQKNLVTGNKGNPILTKDDVPYPVQTVHNAGVTKFNGKYIMLFRSHLNTGRSIIGIAESNDSFNFKTRAEPFMTPSKEWVFCEYEAFGVEDPRITRLAVFDLNDAIANWRRNLEKSGKIGCEHIDEPESHLRDELDQLAKMGPVTEEVFTRRSPNSAT